MGDSGNVTWELKPVKDGAYCLPKYFCAVYDYVGKADLRKGYENPKRKLGGDHAFFRDN